MEAKYGEANEEIGISIRRGVRDTGPGTPASRADKRHTWHLSWSRPGSTLMKNAYPPMKPFLPRPHPGQRSNPGTMGLWTCDRRAFENVRRAWVLRRDAGLRLIPALPPSGSTRRGLVFLSGGPTGRPGPWRRLSKRATSWSWHMCGGNAETWGLAAKVVH